MIEAKIVADSTSEEGVRLTTFQLHYHRFIHSEFMTHRNISRNASSSRAVPVARALQMVREDPAMPIEFGSNKAGMQAGEEVVGAEDARRVWLEAAGYAAKYAELLMELGVHKQVANRVVEPFRWIDVIGTATDATWKAFFALRDHPDAQPEIHELARQMRAALAESEPRILTPGMWHMPYVELDEQKSLGIELSKQCSVARCARVSYKLHDGSETSIEKDTGLYNRLVDANPWHASPTEHQATPDSKIRHGRWAQPLLHGNLHGWVQYRKQLEQKLVK